MHDLAMSIAWSPTGFPLAAAAYGGWVLLYDPANGQELHQLPGHIGSIDSLAWSPDGAQLASGSADGTVIVWGIVP
jgi:WD40 repeat protein